MGLLEALLAAVAGLVGGFISTLASNGSAVTLPALEILGLPDNVANGTNRLSVVALGLVGTVSFYRRSLLDWRKCSWIGALVALGTIVDSLITIESSEAFLDDVIISGLLLVLLLLLFRPDRWLQGKEGMLRPFSWGHEPLATPDVFASPGRCYVFCSCLPR
jgi:uncharacterized membrane protein YfcA